MRRITPLALLTASIAAVGCAVGPATIPAAHAAPATDYAIEKPLKNAFPAIVRIFVTIDVSQGGKIIKAGGAGSGAIITKDGYIVTNHHVAGHGSKIICNLVTQEEIPAELVGTDALTDIAVLKLKLDERKDPSLPLPVAAWGDSDKVRVGDIAFAMGSPGALNQMITRGVVANTAMELIRAGFGGEFLLDGENVGSAVPWLAHDAVIFGGNSGGPLLNTNGEIIGINEIGVVGLSGAIPSNIAYHSVMQIIEHGRVLRSWSGAMIRPRLRGSNYNTGALVDHVVPNSPAHEAGLEAGDILLSYDGHQIDCRLPEHIPNNMNTMYAVPIGKEIKVEAIRDGEKKHFTLTTIDRDIAMNRPVEIKNLGVTTRDMTMLHAVALQRENTDGVVIDSIRVGRAAAKAAPVLMDGDIITTVDGAPVKGVKALANIVDAAENGDTLLLAIERDGEQILSAVTIDNTQDRAKPKPSKKGWIGVDTQVLTVDLAKALGFQRAGGVRVTRVMPNVPGGAPGLEVGDVLRTINGKTIKATRQEHDSVFKSMIRRNNAGETIELGLDRNGEEITVEITLNNEPPEDKDVDNHEDETLELTVREYHWGDLLFAETEEERSANGVIIDKVERGGWGQIARLSAGDVLMKINGQKVKDIQDFKRIMDHIAKEQPKDISFFVVRESGTTHAEVQPAW